VPQSSSDADKGKALAQDPAAQVQVVPGTTVKVTVGTGLENGRDIDVSKDKSFAAVAPRLASAEREQVITEGKQLAQHWRRPS